MSVILERHATLETVALEIASGVDGQGKPAYAAAVSVDARVVRMADVARTVTGTEIRTFATVLIPGGQGTFAGENDRVTTADGLVGIVVEREDGRRINGTLDYVALKLREV